MYRTETPGMAPKPADTVKTRTDQVVDSDGIVTRIPTSAKALRVARGPMPKDPRTVNGPVTSRQATPEEIARMAPRGTASPFSR